MKPLVPALALLGLAACGYVGEPLPPASNFPAPVTDLRVTQRGAVLEAVFTLPTATLEGLPITRRDAIDLRIGPAGPAPFDLARWSGGTRGYAVEWPKEQNEATVTFRAPAADWAGQNVVAGLRFANPKGRFGGYSNLVALAVVEPIAAPAEIRVEERAEGLRFAWKARAGLRFRIQKQETSQPEPVLLATVDKPEYLDEAIDYGRTYRYTIQAFLGEAVSDPSEPVTITPRDTFPPTAPTGLTAIVGAQSIELAWDRSTDFDFARYRVYRSLDGGPAERLAETGINPSYSDRAMQAGKLHRYTVTAIDLRGNESKPSEPFEVRP